MSLLADMLWSLRKSMYQTGNFSNTNYSEEATRRIGMLCVSGDHPTQRLYSFIMRRCLTTKLPNQELCSPVDSQAVQSRAPGRCERRLILKARQRLQEWATYGVLISLRSCAS
jgi:hypothetical protein